MKKKREKDKYIQTLVHLPPSQKRSLRKRAFKEKKKQSHFVRKGLELQGIV